MRPVLNSSSRLPKERPGTSARRAAALAVALLSGTAAAQCENGCSGHGVCGASSCLCGQSWAGQDCSFGLELTGESDLTLPGLSPLAAACPRGCSGHGYCSSGTCVCRTGYFGAACTDQGCPSACFGHGACRGGTCDCYPAWGGSQCELLLGEVVAGTAAPSPPPYLPADRSVGVRPAPILRGRWGRGQDAQVQPQADRLADSAPAPLMLDPRPAPEQLLLRAAAVRTSADLNAVAAQAGVESSRAAGHASVQVAAPSGVAPTAASGPAVANGDSELIGKVRAAVESAGAVADALYIQAVRENRRDAQARIARAIGEAQNHSSSLPGARFGQSMGKKHANPLLFTVNSRVKSIPFNASNLFDTMTGIGCGIGCSGHGKCRGNGSAARCMCASGWVGVDCDTKACHIDCSQRGMCVGGRCLCQSGFYGDGCEHQRCTADCSGHGFCLAGRCTCGPGFGGRGCAVALAQGVATKVETPAQERFRRLGPPRVGLSSLRSDTRHGCPGNCYGHGACVDDKCICHQGFQGQGCKQFCPRSCSGHGACVLGACLCLAGWHGEDCTTQGCCSGHGTCRNASRCTCDPGWSGPQCSFQLTCKSQTCSGHGVCHNGACVCASGYSGPACDVAGKGCERFCLHARTCDPVTRTCACLPGWTGPECRMRTVGKGGAQIGATPAALPAASVSQLTNRAVGAGPASLKGPLIWPAGAHVVGAPSDASSLVQRESPSPIIFPARMPAKPAALTEVVSTWHRHKELPVVTLP